MRSSRAHSVPQGCCAGSIEVATCAPQLPRFPATPGSPTCLLQTRQQALRELPICLVPQRAYPPGLLCPHCLQGMSDSLSKKGNLGMQMQGMSALV